MPPRWSRHPTGCTADHQQTDEVARRGAQSGPGTHGKQRGQRVDTAETKSSKPNPGGVRADRIICPARTRTAIGEDAIPEPRGTVALRRRVSSPWPKAAIMLPGPAENYDKSGTRGLLRGF